VGCTLFSCVVVYIMGHVVGLPMVSHTIHLPKCFTIIIVVWSWGASWDEVSWLGPHVVQCDVAIACPLEIVLWVPIFHKVISLTTHLYLMSSLYIFQSCGCDSVGFTYECNCSKSLMLAIYIATIKMLQVKILGERNIIKECVWALRI
jgi:hypothetical protein